MPIGECPRARIEHIVRDSGGGSVKVEILAPEIAQAAGPGQFVSLRIPGSGEPLLSRPFSIAGRKGDTIILLIKVAGNVTRRIGDMEPGMTLHLTGPLGRGYRIDPERERGAVLVAGGYGAASLLFLADTLHERKPKASLGMYIGTRGVGEMPLRAELEARAWMTVKWATEDGSSGFKGTVLELFREFQGDHEKRSNVYACGPLQMLAGLARISKEMRLHVSLETHMACGMGRCQGCAVPMLGGRGMGRYLRVCMDGPVFEASEVDWDAVGTIKNG